MTRKLTIAYTPDSDDAFYYYALENGLVTLPGVEFEFVSDHIINLNRRSLQQEFDVAAISSVAYPGLADKYRILSVGTSVGRGYGPVLVSQKYHTLEELKGKRIAVAGIPTTGGFLAMYALQDCEVIEHQFDQIADAIVDGQFDAGVMIHEELLYFPQKGLHKVDDLGAVWQQRTNLPLPVGLNVVNRDLGEALMNDAADCIRESLCYALTHRAEALAWATRFGRGEDGDCGEQHIEMFANVDSVMLPDDVRTGLRVLFPMLMGFGIAETVPLIDIVEGSEETLQRSLSLISPSRAAA